MCSRAMQHGSIIAQEAQTTIQYAESYVFWQAHGELRAPPDTQAGFKGAA